MRKLCVIGLVTLFVLSFSMCHKAGVYPDSGYDDRLSGGVTTTLDASSQAFSSAMDGLSTRDGFVHTAGDNTFSQVFITPPAKLFGGLGPVFNNVSCVNCHRNDGEGLPTAGLSNSGLLVRISVPGLDTNGGPLAATGFGLQIQDQNVFGAKPEASVNIAYTPVPVTYPDGTVVTLQKPVVTLQNPYIPLPAGYMLSPRLAPKLVGLGLLENIPEQTILSFVDAGDKNGDGITGKANYVYDPHTQKMVLGRFGLKANTASLLTQVAAAYQQDMGITNYIFPAESCAGQAQMSVLNGIPDNSPELVDSLLNYVTYYVRTLAVPARRDVTNADNISGAAIFNQINCAACHIPTIQTGVDVTLPQVSNQRIHPYTDMLLHNMGDGLADGRPDYLATGNEWRTSPLWGIGLLQKVNGAPYFLHDGRARSIEEAILWHGGEAAAAKTAFMNLTAADRAKLLKFLQSL